MPGSCLRPSLTGERPLNERHEDIPGTDKLVAHSKDGEISKGYSRDFSPDQDLFHIVLREGEVAASTQIRLDDLKALFHVKTWGRSDKHLGTEPGFPKGSRGRPTDASFIKTVLEFSDGEKIFCYSRDYDPERKGFYALPADPEDNNTKIYVVNSSLVNIQFLRE